MDFGNAFLNSLLFVALLEVFVLAQWQGLFAIVEGLFAGIWAWSWMYIKMLCI